MDVSPGLDEDFYDVGPPYDGGDHQGRFAVARPGIHVGAGLEETLNLLDVARIGGHNSGWSTDRVFYTLPEGLRGYGIGTYGSPLKSPLNKDSGEADPHRPPRPRPLPSRALPRRHRQDSTSTTSG